MTVINSRCIEANVYSIITSNFHTVKTIYSCNPNEDKTEESMIDSFTVSIIYY